VGLLYWEGTLLTVIGKLRASKRGVIPAVRLPAGFAVNLFPVCIVNYHAIRSVFKALKLAADCFHDCF
jgi:hypothetical protein